MYSVPTTVETIGALSVSTTVHTWIGTWGKEKVEKEEVEEDLHLLLHLHTNLHRHFHTFLLRLKVGNLRCCSLVKVILCSQDHLFHNVNAVFIALWSAFYIGDRLQHIEAIHSRNLATLLLRDFPKFDFLVWFVVNVIRTLAARLAGDGILLLLWNDTLEQEGEAQPLKWNVRFMVVGDGRPT